MKIGIIGSGIVGRVLGKAFLTEGNEVMLGTRNTSKDEVVKWKKDNPKGQTGNFEATAKFGELLVLATGGAVTEDAIRLAGTGNFKNKTVIDATNPIAAEPPVNGVLKFFTDFFYKIFRPHYGFYLFSNIKNSGFFIHTFHRK